MLSFLDIQCILSENKNILLYNYNCNDQNKEI